MQKLTLNEVLEKFDLAFAAAKKERFKVEVLQDYSATDDGPSLQAWKGGDHEKAKELLASDPSTGEWVEMCHETPAKIIRIHIVERPLTAYLEWEIEVAYKTVAIPLSGEQVYLLDKAKTKALDMPSGDFWIFDGRRVIQFEYEDGLVTGGWETDDPKEVKRYLRLREDLLKEAEPLS